MLDLSFASIGSGASKATSTKTKEEDNASEASKDYGNSDFTDDGEDGELEEYEEELNPKEEEKEGE